MVVFCLPSEQIAAAVAASMYFTDKPHLSEYLKKTINSNQSNTRAFWLHLLVYIGWGKVFLA